MIADCLQILRRAIPAFPLGSESVALGHWSSSPRFRRVFYPCRDRRDAIVSAYLDLFEPQTERNPRTGARGGILRNGIAGDWKTRFAPTAGKAFHHHSGETLVRLGCERDRNWAGEPIED